MASVFLLTREDCNGEYGTEGHCSVWTSEALAKAAHARLVRPYGKDPARVTERDPEDTADYYDKWLWSEYKRGVQEFRTGRWGYTVWTLREMPVDPVFKTEQINCSWCRAPLTRETHGGKVAAEGDDECSYDCSSLVGIHGSPWDAPDPEAFLFECHKYLCEERRAAHEDSGDLSREGGGEERQ